SPSGPTDDVELDPSPRRARQRGADGGGGDEVLARLNGSDAADDQRFRIRPRGMFGARAQPEYVGYRWPVQQNLGIARDMRQKLVARGLRIDEEMPQTRKGEAERRRHVEPRRPIEILPACEQEYVMHVENAAPAHQREGGRRRIP